MLTPSIAILIALIIACYYIYKHDEEISAYIFRRAFQYSAADVYYIFRRVMVLMHYLSSFIEALFIMACGADILWWAMVWVKVARASIHFYVNIDAYFIRACKNIFWRARYIFIIESSTMVIKSK